MMGSVQAVELREILGVELGVMSGKCWAGTDQDALGVLVRMGYGFHASLMHARLLGFCNVFSGKEGSLGSLGLCRYRLLLLFCAAGLVHQRFLFSPFLILLIPTASYKYCIL